MKYTAFMFIGSLMASILASLETFMVFMILTESTSKVLEKRRSAKVGVKEFDNRIQFEFFDRSCDTITIDSSRVTATEATVY